VVALVGATVALPSLGNEVNSDPSLFLASGTPSVQAQTLGAHGLQISSVTPTLLIVLILGAGTDYGLFLVYRFREGLRAGKSDHDAIIRALTRVGESITGSAGTVILALLTLLFAGFGLYHDLGVPLALGIAVMLLAGLTLLPALLAVTAGAMFAADRRTSRHAGAGRGARRARPGTGACGAGSRPAPCAVPSPCSSSARSSSRRSRSPPPATRPPA
jgi:uncharacterized membrane protein YdfJ with MMPL/SSD domain